MPANLYGIKWNFQDSLTAKATFVTYRMPMWLDFYAKDGKKDGVWATVWDTGFTYDDIAGPTTWAELLALKSTDGRVYDGQGNLLYRKILASDTDEEGLLIPEPSSVALLVLALGAGLYSGGKGLRRKA